MSAVQPQLRRRTSQSSSPGLALLAPSADRERSPYRGPTTGEVILLA
jgi:hypothetical protein